MNITLLNNLEIDVEYFVVTETDAVATKPLIVKDVATLFNVDQRGIIVFSSSTVFAEEVIAKTEKSIVRIKTILKLFLIMLDILFTSL